MYPSEVSEIVNATHPLAISTHMGHFPYMNLVWVFRCVYFCFLSKDVGICMRYHDRSTCSQLFLFSLV